MGDFGILVPINGVCLRICSTRSSTDLDVFSNFQVAFSEAKPGRPPVGPKNRVTIKRNTKTRKEIRATRETCGPGCDDEAISRFYLQLLLIPQSAGLVKLKPTFPPRLERIEVRLDSLTNDTHLGPNMASQSPRTGS